ncbi:tudor and KH domain-containing protein-like [Diadema setosum]|uniref:tudor and KH domain-containing protein-like n=1 Tax=Diadema setosum TaxID=31175 RepID=UPI003B3A8772
MDQLTTRQKVALAVALPVSVVLLYLLLKKKKEDDDVLKPSGNLATAQRQTIDMSVPCSKVGSLIGRDGCNIRKIQAESGAQVKFMDETKRDDDADRQLRISGNRDSILLAEKLIQDFLASQPEIISKIILIPQQAVGRIIGRQGANIRKIQNSSGARVKIDRMTEDTTQPEVTRSCYIRGSKQQVDSAEYMIREEIAEVEDYNQRLAEAAAKRKQRPTGKPSKQSVAVQRPEEAAPETAALLTAEPLEEAETLWNREETSVVEPPKGKDFFTVYMSAVEHPGHFWLQMVNSKAQQLDLLQDNMTEFYNKPETRESFAVSAVRAGDIIASPFAHDQSWYRARVLGLLENDMVDVYYVDFGDCAAVARSDVCLLRGDFLSLPFQAVEFSLAGVQPIGDQWAEDAITHFEALTSVAQWKPLMAKIIDYQSSDGETIPCVDLFDCTGDNDINIAKQLKYRGFAKWSTPRGHQDSQEANSANVTVSPHEGTQASGDSNASAAVHRL